MLEGVFLIAALFVVPMIYAAYRKQVSRLFRQDAPLQEKIDALAAALRGSNERQVYSALTVLQEDCNLARHLLPDIVRLMRPPQSPEVVRIASLALGNCNASTPETVSALSPLVSHQSEGIRRAAVWALSTSYSDLTKGPLLAAMADPIPAVRMLALIGLERYAQLKDASIVSAVTRGLGDSDPSVQYRAALLAERLGVVAKDSIPAMIRLLETTLNETSNLTRSNICKALAQMGSLAEPAVPALVDLTMRYGESVEGSTFEVFAAAGPAAKEAIPLIARALEEGDRPKTDHDKNKRTYRVRRFRASQALVAIGAASVPAVLKLLALDKSARDPIELSRWESDDLQYRVASILEDIGIQALPPLLELMMSSTDGVRRGAIYAFSRVGKTLGAFDKASDAIAFLVSIAGDESDRDQDIALFSLAKIFTDHRTLVSKPEIRSLESALLDQAADPKVCFSGRYAAQLIFTCGSAESVTKLVELRSSPDERTALEGIKAAKKFVPEKFAEAAVSLLRSNDESLRCELVRLASDTPDEAALPVLIQALEDESDRIVKIATEALESSKSTRAVEALRTFRCRSRIPLLVARLGSSTASAYERSCAARELGELDSPIAVPPLFDALAAEDSDLRERAMQSLAKLLLKVTADTSRLLDTLRSTKCSKVAEWSLRQMETHKVPNSLMTLMDVYSSSRNEVRRAAAYALGALGDEAKPAVGTLIAGLLEDDWGRGSLSALVQIGDAAVPEIVRNLSDVERLPALVAILGTMKTPFSLEALKDHAIVIEQASCKTEVCDLGLLAVGALRIAKTHPNPARQLAKRIKFAELHSNGNARIQVAKALLATGVDSDRSDAIFILQSALRDRLSSHRDQALESLASLLAPMELEKCTIIKLACDLEHPGFSLFSDRLQYETAEELLQFESEVAENAVSAFARKKLPELIATLEAAKLSNEIFDTDPLKAVGALGRFAAPAVPALRDLLKKETDEFTKSRILIALDKVQSSNVARTGGTDA